MVEYFILVESKLCERHTISIVTILPYHTVEVSANVGVEDLSKILLEEFSDDYKEDIDKIKGIISFTSLTKL